jgi:hypothetical protein
MRQRNGASKQNVLTSGSPVANIKSGTDYSEFITKYFFFFFFFFVLHTL